MNTRVLIDAIVRQTTVLLAQLSTAAGVRSPLAHIADEVFVSLSKEIEAQGVGRKVAADMFGLALRAYQKKVQRLAESSTDRETTLWESVHDFVRSRGGASREEILTRFARDGSREVVGVLTDLVSSGLIHASGRGAAAVYGATSERERQLLAEAADEESTATLVWAAIRGGSGMTVAQVAEFLRLGPERATSAVERLLSEGRLRRTTGDADGPLEASPLLIPVGAEMGWEAAVFDHFRAVASAIAAKVRSGSLRSDQADVVGGATLSFRICAAHPHRTQVLGLLQRARAEANALWDEVERYNEERPFADEERVWFYVGQYVESDSD